jgi:CO/xanthine dehydrogenase FAD-binding subunit
MDLGTVEDVVAGAKPADWRPGDAWLAGGTWLFSEPQPQVRRLLDLAALDWPPFTVGPNGLEIAATSTIAELYRFAAGSPPEWTIGPLIRQCCDAFLASFKIWNEATVGGNLINALPAGPMISLLAALDGRCEIWLPSGETRWTDVVDLIIGDNRHGLAPGELVRSITVPPTVLHSRTAFRRQSLTMLGRSAALLIGRQDPDGAFTLTVTASTVRPLALRFASLPGPAELRAAIEAIGNDLYHDDVHGHPTWRRHLTFRLAEEIRAELANPTPAEPRTPDETRTPAQALDSDQAPDAALALRLLNTQTPGDHARIPGRAGDSCMITEGCVGVRRPW